MASVFLTAKPFHLDDEGSCRAFFHDEAGMPFTPTVEPASFIQPVVYRHCHHKDRA